MLTDKDRDGTLVELLVIFTLLYLAAYLPGDAAASGRALSLPLGHMLILAQTLPRALFLVWFLGTRKESEACGLGALGRGRRSAALLGALVAAAGAFAIAILPRVMFRALGLPAPESPLMGAMLGAAPPIFPLLPLAMASSLSVGYSEELFFRGYLMKRLGDLGLKPAATLAVSALLFGSAHGLQGLYGLLGASAIGAWFAFLRLRGAGIHVLGLGHGLYDFAAIVLSLYGLAK